MKMCLSNPPEHFNNNKSKAYAGIFMRMSNSGVAFWLAQYSINVKFSFSYFMLDVGKSRRIESHPKHLSSKNCPENVTNICQ